MSYAAAVIGALRVKYEEYADSRKSVNCSRKFVFHFKTREMSANKIIWAQKFLTCEAVEIF